MELRIIAEHPLHFIEFTVNPGDFVLVGEDGALVVPGDRIDHVLAHAEELPRTEVRIRKSLVQGVSLQDCLDRLGHALPAVA